MKKNVLWAVGVILALVLASRFTRHRAPAAPPAASTAARAPTGALTIAAVGDSLIVRPVSGDESEPAFAAVAKLVRDASVAVTNLELNVVDAPTARAVAQASENPLWPHATPAEAKELRWLGFDMISVANNHATDYGIDGMLATGRHLDELGLVHAGSGRNLDEARAPAYFRTAGGRVAMIAVASSHSPASRAARVRLDIQGRPGLSPLRLTQDIVLDAATFASFKRTLAGLSWEPSASDDKLNLSGTPVRKGERNRVELIADARDVQAILAQVVRARHQADLVLVSIHAHEPGNLSEVPAEFLPAFARAAIEAGADMVVGHGPHQLRGIEIYKKRPIFYSLGNFLFQYQTIAPEAADAYETSGRGMALNSIGEVAEAAHEGTPAFKEDVWWESVLALSTFNRGALKSVELHPLDLGVRRPPALKGTPRAADPALARKIIDRLARLSESFGTRIRFADGAGVIELEYPDKR